MIEQLRCLWRDDRGQDLIEYAMLAAVLAVGVGAIMPEVAGKLHQIYEHVNAQIARADPA